MSAKPSRLIEKENEPLVMQYAGGFVKHLGLQMYSNAPAAIAELVANAWDADSPIVDVKIPFGESFTNESEIVVEDNGKGMSYDDCNKAYLVLGRDRRVEEKKDTTDKGRPLLGHKGIGKLAGFGIARIVIVRTVKDGELTWFKMDLEEIEKKKRGEEYKPELIQHRSTTEKNGTKITLKMIKLSRLIDEDVFRNRMSIRFGIISDQFVVKINGKKLEKWDIDTEFRFPKKNGKWFEERINGEKIEWWIGFTETPIKEDEERGITVLVRGKLAQLPTFFGMSGGGYGQHGLQYITGQIKADFLDKKLDLIATDRGNILWEHPIATPLRDWGKKKIQELLNKWVELRHIKNLKAFKKQPEYYQALTTLTSKQSDQIMSVINKVLGIPTMSKDDRNEIITFIINAVKNRYVMNLIKQLNSASSSDREDFLKAVNEWNVIDANIVASRVMGHIEIIKQFIKMIDENAREVPTLHKHMQKFPWLLDINWELYKHEERLDNIIKNSIRSKSKKTLKRVDFFCMVLRAGSGNNSAKVVEIKRGRGKMGKKELEQIRSYVLELREKCSNTTDPEIKIKPENIEGLLIGKDVQNGLGSEIKSLQDTGIYTRMWDEHLSVIKKQHEQFFAVVKDRLPEKNRKELEKLFDM